MASSSSSCCWRAAKASRRSCRRGRSRARSACRSSCRAAFAATPLTSMPTVTSTCGEATTTSSAASRTISRATTGCAGSRCGRARASRRRSAKRRWRGSTAASPSVVRSRRGMPTAWPRRYFPIRCRPSPWACSRSRRPPRVTATRPACGSRFRIST